MWQLEDVCDRFCIIAGGVVRARGSLDELRAAVPERVIRVAPDAPAVRAVLDRVGRRGAANGGTRVDYHVRADDDFAGILSELVGVAAITHFEPVPPSLASIYLRAIGRNDAEASVP
jgi:ABC-type uncharacterized transport system ATPase subunit